MEYLDVVNIVQSKHERKRFSHTNRASPFGREKIMGTQTRIPDINQSHVEIRQYRCRTDTFHEYKCIVQKYLDGENRFPDLALH